MAIFHTWSHSHSCMSRCRVMIGCRIPSMLLLVPSDLFISDGCFHCLWASAFDHPWPLLSKAVSPLSQIPDIRREPPRTLRLVLPSVHSLKRWSLHVCTLIPICSFFSLHFLLLGITCLFQEVCWQCASNVVARSQFSLHVPSPQPN